jgi:gliding motility-associated-like protein
MKKIFSLILSVVCLYGTLSAQSPNCSGAMAFCSGSTTYPASTGAGSAETGPNYGCLGSEPNPAWFFMQVSSPGNISLTITASPPRDIDFILYGPFTSPTSPCTAGLTAANTEDCSYAGGTAPEVADINGGLAGEYYLLLLTNYSNQPTNVTFAQTSGSGSTSCAVICNITGVTATPSVCDPTSNTYSLSGQVAFSAAPTTGTLTVTNSCGGSQVFNPPFTSPIAYNFPGLNSNGASCAVTATFSATAGCTQTVNYTAPADCTPCVATANNNGPLCEGDSLYLSAGTVAGAVSYSWTGPGGFVSNLQNPSIVPVTISNAGTYTVTVTTSSSSCSETTTVTISPAPLVDAGFTAGICYGDNITLGGNGSAGTYSWSPSSSLDDATILTPTASPTVTTTYTLTVTNSFACSASDTVTIYILNPSVDAGPNVSICPGSSIMLNASGGDSYQWSPASSLSDPNIANPIATPASTTTYTVIISNSVSGCTAVDSVTVTITPAVFANAGNDASICIGNSTILGASGGTSYNWNPATGLSDPTIVNPVASPVTTTTYTVLVTDAAGCVSSDSVMITVNMLPNVTAGADQSVCLGAGAQLVASGAVTYSWSPGTTLSDSLIFNPVASPLVLTSYVVTGTDVNGCVNTDTVSVNVNSATITAGAASSTICYGDSTALNASGALSYVWSPLTTVPPANDSILSNDSIANPIAFPLGTTVYTVIGTDVNGCRDTTSVTVTVNQLPIVNAGASLSVCSGSNANLSATGANSYVWSPSTFLNNPNIPNPIASPTTTTQYIVTGTDLNLCSNSDTIIVTVNPLPVANAGTNTSICAGDTTMLNASGGGTYSWSPAIGLSNTNISNPLAFPASTTTYSLTVSGAGFCSSTSQVTITVNSVPVATASADASICNGGSTVLSATGGGTYFWTPSAGLNNTTSSNPTATPATTTQYVVTVSNAAGCTDKDTVIVNVSNSMNIASSNVTDETCFDNDGTITVGSVSGGTGPYTYSVNGGPAQSSNMFSSLSQGSYVITAIDAGGCITSQTVAVNQISNVDASFTATPPSGPKPLSVNFSNTSTGATNYIWNFGNGLTSLQSNPSTVYPSNGSYTITLYVYNGGFPCIDSASFTVEVFEEMMVVIPNVITPNGDGKNDVFTIQSSGVSQLDGTIFNRWGKKVYEWNGNAQSGWNGTVNGNSVADGTYYYILKLRGMDGTETEQKGYIQVFSN